MAFATTAHSSRSARNLGKIAALGDGAELVAGAADSLQSARHRFGALDLDHEVDGAHVDAELEARRRDEARDLARLQQLLDLHALLASDRPVVCPRNLRVCQLVEPDREALREPAVVDEHDRRAVRADELEQRRVDRRPDRAGCRLVARGHLHAVRHHRLGEGAVPAGLPHVLERYHDLEVELLPDAGVDELDRSPAGDEARRSPPAAAGSPRAQCAGRAARRSAPAVRARAPDARRASCRRPRAPRRRSPSPPRPESGAPARSAAGRATRAW